MRKLLAGLTISLAILIAFFYGSALVSRRPVLFHILADTDCACGDFHEDVTGLILLNPFRDRSPEKAGSCFLEGLRNDRCTAETSICRYALDNHRISAWRLANVRDVGSGVGLYYKLTKFGSDEAKYRFTGEGFIEVVRAQDGWTVASYSSYF